MIDPNDFEGAILDQARRHGVVPDIHPKDFIFQFLITNESFTSREAAVAYYFSDGESSCKKLLDLLGTFGKAVAGEETSVLEFASGYGCVSRHLEKQRGYRVTSCDIHVEANAFIADKIGLPTLQSAHCPEDFSAKDRYDVTFALSFFSHMPAATWSRWLGTLLDTVIPGGLLIFTTQGRASAKFFGNPILNEQGYWFRADSEQKDLSVEEYGQTLVTPEYVFRELSERVDAHPCFFQQAHWWKHQDTYVVQKAG
jgi:SAM-dependent methyltransferase